MTDSTYAALESIVSRVLKPVWASPARKRLLREELLAHVIDVFTEEFASTGNEQTALAQTTSRFGAAEEVGCELQDALTFFNRWFCLFSKENLMSRWLWFTAVVAIFVGPALIMPAVAAFKQTEVWHLVPLLIGVAITLGGLSGVAYGLKQRFARAS